MDIAIMIPLKSWFINHGVLNEWEQLLSNASKDKPKTEDLDVTLCSHLILIGSCTLNDECRIMLPPVELISEMNKLKERNDRFKVLFSLTPNNRCMSKVVLNGSLTDELVNKVTDYIVKKSVDGFDIDWEFPVWSADAQPTDKKGFTVLLEELRKSFDRARKGILLTVAVAAPFSIVKKAYDISAFNRYVDLVQVMNYDFHIFSKTQTFTAFNAPLFRKFIEFGVLGKMNSDYSTRFWLDSGLFRNKTVFGIPTYGRGYTLVDRYVHFVYAPASGVSIFGETYHFLKVCNLTLSSDYVYVFDEKACSPYLHGGEKQWLGFEDTTSMFVKATYARRAQLAGIMIFDLASDDFSGLCGKGKYPLTRAAKAALEETHPAEDTHLEPIII
uniref:GH18 domain-containing protein n=1 Tax=Ascaris lumbricoides TaxID=6252 RepID=A0A0M3I3Z8_ASCLU